MTESALRDRVLTCTAFDPSGLILAWSPNGNSSKTIVGFIHAFKPPPITAAYERWGRYHTIAVLYVVPEHRRRGIGGRLLKAAEDWLYYCPIHFAGQSVPCYGSVEGPRPPFFGSTQRMGVSVNDSELLHFLAKRGYSVVDPGDVSMTANLRERTPKSPAIIALNNLGLRLVQVNNNAPFHGEEPPDRQEYSSWGHNRDIPYAGLILVDKTDHLRGHICWYPLRESQRAGIYAFWLTPSLRGKGLGALLLDTALTDMAGYSHLGGPFAFAEVQTHLVRHAGATALYESRGFHIDGAWVTLVKT